MKRVVEIDLKNIYIILVLILIVGVAGCASTNTGSDSDKSVNNSIYNQSTPQKIVNTSQSLKPPSYEASGYCPYVVDGDTIDVDGVGRIRFVGVNTPERGQPGYQEAKDFVKSLCLGKTVGVDMDNAKTHDKYGRVLAVVYVGDINVNRELLKNGYAQIMYIPPSEFNPYSWT